MVNKASEVLGIIGICIGWLIPIVGLILGIVGICQKKIRVLGWNLNMIAIIESIIAWIGWSIIWY
jgi:hypothetical protein